jgi:hypothetical protein
MRKSSTLFLSVLVGFLCIHSSHGIPRAWTWLNGDSIVNPIGVYGTAGVPTGVETPGSRRSACTAYDPTFREFYVFGGFGQTNTTSAGGTIRSWRLEPGDEIIFHFFSCFQIGFLPSRSAILPGKLTSSCVIVIKDPSCVSHDFWRRNTGFMSDFWKFDAATSLWTWIGGSFVAPSRPGLYAGGRYEAACAYDTLNHVMYIYGGFGYADAAGSPGSIDDIWKWNRTSGIWSKLSGGAGNQLPSYSGQLSPAGRLRAAAALDERKQIFWVYGGVNAAGDRLSDLWAFFPGNTSWSWFGGGGSDIGQMTTRGIATIGDHPGSRESAIMWIDPPKSSLYLFGGFGESPSSGVGYHNDLWVYANGSWKWISGDAAIDQVNTNNNVKNVFDVQYWPCSRAQTSGSYDPTTGYFYMFGGRGVTFGGTGALADLWAFSIGNNGVRKIRVTWGFL